MNSLIHFFKGSSALYDEHVTLLLTRKVGLDQLLARFGLHFTICNMGIIRGLTSEAKDQLS